MRPTATLATLLLAAFPLASMAAEPEIDRGEAAAQAVGAAHTLRTIPEACARLEGMFTGQAVDLYRFAVVRTSPNCQPRARFVDAEKAAPSVAAGWILNDRISVPNGACPSQKAVVEVWRKPGDAAPPELDAQGRARIYLQDAKKAAAGGRRAEVSVFAATMTVDGAPCGG